MAASRAYVSTIIIVFFFIIIIIILNDNIVRAVDGAMVTNLVLMNLSSTRDHTTWPDDDADDCFKIAIRGKRVCNRLLCLLLRLFHRCCLHGITSRQREAFQNRMSSELVLFVQHVD